MITTPTLLILGAGASYPYGYPLGKDLVGLILDIATCDNELAKACASGDTPQRLEQLRTRLGESDVESIDDFLEARKDLLDVGKIAIAAALTRYGPQPTEVRDANQDWRRYLWNVMKAGADSFASFRRNMVSVITYNYDTGLEHYFSRVIGAQYFDGDYAEAAAVRPDVLPVVHLHGEIPIDAPRVLEESRLREISKGLQIVHENTQRNYQRAHELLMWAKNVHFLGFGYHPTNVGRLAVDTHFTSRPEHGALGGTAFGLWESERHAAITRVSKGGLWLAPSNHDCLVYLQNRLSRD